MTDLVTKAREFAIEAHKGQKRKNSVLDYSTHVIFVSKLVESIGARDEMVAAAASHDLAEDCGITIEEIASKFGGRVASLVSELTNVYTKENFPKFSRKDRKALELERLARITSDAQTIKYADIFHNSLDIYYTDRGFAEVFLKEKRKALDVMGYGDYQLRQMASLTVDYYLDLIAKEYA